MEKELIQAAKSGNYDEVEKLLNNGADIHYLCRARGASALFWAVYYNHDDLVKYLISHKADIYIKDKFGITPALCAAKRGHIKILERLLAMDAELIKEKTPKNLTALILAAKKGETAMVNFLLEKKLSSIQEEDQFGHDALYYAIKKGYKKTAEMLYKMEHSYFTEDKLKKALALAIKTERADLVEMLINLNKIDDYRIGENLTPFLYAVSLGSMPMVKLLLEMGADPKWTSDDPGNGTVTALHVLMQYGSPNLNLAKYLIELGVDFNCMNKHGTVLHHIPYYSAENLENDYTAFVMDLLKKEASTSATDHQKRTPLHCAALRSNIALIKLFLDWGVESFPPDENGDTPLLLFAKHLKSEISTKESTLILKLLLEHGETVSARNKEDMGVLDLLIQKNRCAEVEFLVELGAELGKRNKNNETLLHIACKEGAELSVEYLLKKDFDPNAEDTQGQTPLFYCYTFSKVNTLRSLLFAKGKMDHRNQNGLSALFSSLTGFPFSNEVVDYGYGIEVMLYLLDNFSVNFKEVYNQKTILDYQPLSRQKDSRILHCILSQNAYTNREDLLTLCEKEPHFVNARQLKDGNTVLHLLLAKQTPDLNLISMLLTRCVNIDVENNNKISVFSCLTLHSNPYLKMIGYYYKAHQIAARQLSMCMHHKAETTRINEQEYIQKGVNCIQFLEESQKGAALYLWGRFLAVHSTLPKAYPLLSQIKETDRFYSQANWVIYNSLEKESLCLPSQASKENQLEAETNALMLIKYGIQARLAPPGLKKMIVEFFSAEGLKKGLSFNSFNDTDSCLSLIETVKNKKMELESKITQNETRLLKQTTELKTYEESLLKLRKELSDKTVKPQVFLMEDLSVTLFVQWKRQRTTENEPPIKRTEEPERTAENDPPIKRTEEPDRIFCDAPYKKNSRKRLSHS